MSIVTLYKNKCTGCSICSKVCPNSLFYKDEDNKYAVSPNVQKFCIKCGQCEAFCPAGAIDVNYPGAEAYNGPIEVEDISSGQMRHFMANRRSIRNFKKNAVDKKVIEELLEIVRHAPTGGNSQNVGWIIIHDTEKMKKLREVCMEWAKKVVSEGLQDPRLSFLKRAVERYEAGYDMIFRDAPNLVIAYAPSNGSSISTNAVIALTYLELSAPAYGAGTCWDGFFHTMASASEEIRKEIGLPEGYSVSGALMIGYPELKQMRVPKRNGVKASWI